MKNGEAKIQPSQLDSRACAPNATPDGPDGLEFSLPIDKVGSFYLLVQVRAEVMSMEKVLLCWFLLT